MQEEERLEWEALPTAELVDELLYTGLRMPEGLIGEIVGRGSEAVPELGRLAATDALWASRDPEERWASLFALHLLGAIGDPAGIPFVIHALRLDPDQDLIVENTPTILAHLGPAAIAPLAQFVLDEGANGLMRGVACDGLAAIAVLHPEARAPIIGFLRRFVEEAPQHDKDAVTGAVLALVALRDSESLVPIMHAFHAGQVDEDMLYPEDARDGMSRPDELSGDWHYTGDPLEFFAPGNLERLRQQEEKRRERREKHAHG